MMRIPQIYPVVPFEPLVFLYSLTLIAQISYRYLTKIFMAIFNHNSTCSPCKNLLPLAQLYASAKVAGLHIPRHRGQLHHKPVQLLAHLHLAPQPAGLGQTEGQIQHVVLVVLGLGDPVVESVVGDDDMAGSGCQAKSSISSSIASLAGRRSTQSGST